MASDVGKDFLSKGTPEQHAELQEIMDKLIGERTRVYFLNKEDQSEVLIEDFCFFKELLNRVANKLQKKSRVELKKICQLDIKPGVEERHYVDEEWFDLICYLNQEMTGVGNQEDI